MTLMDINDISHLNDHGTIQVTSNDHEPPGKSLISLIVY